MSDISRQQKLASAKKKLKKYQQGKSPDGLSPSDEKLGKEILRGIQNNHIFKTPSLTVSNNKQNLLNGVHKNKKDSPIVNQKLNFSNSPVVNGNLKQNSSSPAVTSNGTTHSSLIGSPKPNVGLADNSFNNTVTRDLEESLTSYKRVNEQLGNQVNGQRKQILQLQEQLKKESVSAAQLTEQRALKEQLEVHIQTIGILVSEKSELQCNNSTVQKKLLNKEAELEEINSQIHNMQQQGVDLQKQLSQLHTSEGQLRQTTKEVVQERDRFSNKLYGVNQEKEELLLQNSELHTKLLMKVEECTEFLNQVNQLQLKLQQGELMVQQLSANGIDINNLTKWNEEKGALLQTVEQQKEMMKKLVHDKVELLEKQNDTQGHYDLQIETLKNMVNSLEKEKLILIERSHSLSEKIEDLQNQLSSKMTTKVAENPEVDRDMKFNVELENAVNEKTLLEKELDVQINENRRLGRLVFEQNIQIEELEANVKSLKTDSLNKSTLLEQIQADKETISRALTQNKCLKEQLEELEDGFVKVSNNSADLTGRLESEQHGNKDVAAKLSAIQVDLEESKLKLNEKTHKCEELETQLEHYKTESSSAKNKMDAAAMDLDLLSTELETTKNELVMKEQNLVVALDSSKLVEKLQEELNSAQNALNQLSYQNLDLTEKLESLQLSKNQNDGNLYPEREHFSESCTDEPDVADEGSEEEKRNFEGLDVESDIMDDKAAIMVTRAEIEEMELNLRQLQEERNRVMDLLQEEREKSFSVAEEIEKHVSLQLEQRLRQRERELCEHFYEQTEALQNKVKSLQEALEIMRKNEDISDFDMVSDGISMPSLKTAFVQLQKKYKSAMDLKAQYADRIERLEHTNFQLEHETETIGEYITLYQSQRSALKTKFVEKDQIIQQISNEHGRMQAKVTQLHHLVMQMLSERSGYESKNKQLQELVNRRLALQNGETTSEVPKLDYDLDNLFGQMTLTPDEEVELIKDNIPVHEEMRSSSVSDQTTQQILQIFEQLETTGEGYQHGWLSPAARKHDFQPCKNCMGPLTSL